MSLPLFNTLNVGRRVPPFGGPGSAPVPGAALGVPPNAPFARGFGGTPKPACETQALPGPQASAYQPY